MTSKMPASWRVFDLPECTSAPSGSRSSTSSRARSPSSTTTTSMLRSRIRSATRWMVSSDAGAAKSSRTWVISRSPPSLFALPHASIPLLLYSMSSSIAGGGSQQLDGQWLEEIASYGSPDLLLTPRLGIATTGSRRQSRQNLRIGLRQLCLLGEERQGQAKQRFAAIWSRFGLFD